MPFQIINADITGIECDAIVNPTDRIYSGSGGADYTIHEVAGRELMDAACAELPPLETGSVEVTGGFNLPCRYVLHTTGPVWNGGRFNETVLLRSCYMNALVKADRMGLKSVAFPLISSGTFGFPKDRVLKIATEAVSDFLFTAENEIDVFICIKDKNAYELKYASELRSFIDDTTYKTYRTEPGIPAYMYRPNKRRKEEQRPEEDREVCYSMCEDAAFKSEVPAAGVCEPVRPCAPAPRPAQSLEKFIRETDAGFAEMLLGLVEKKGMSFVDCYKKANLTKSIAYHIRNDKDYHPSKSTILSFAIALKLTFEETEQLLKTMGYSMSPSLTSDRIIEFYIRIGNYNVFEINEALYQYDQVPLGCL